MAVGGHGGRDRGRPAFSAVLGGVGGVISHGFTYPNGQAIPSSVINSCFNAHNSLSNACLVRHHVFQSFLYEPPSRFWPLQGIEAAIFLAVVAPTARYSRGVDQTPDRLTAHGVLVQASSPLDRVFVLWGGR